MDDESISEKLVSSSTIYAGNLFNLRKDTMLLPNGKLAKRFIIEHPGAVAIIPIIEDKIVLIRQFRQATGKILYEIPAGTLKEGEKPDKCAARELEEETGYVAGNLKRLFYCYPAPGYSTELIHFYLATNLEKTRRRADSDEFIEVYTVPRRKAKRMVKLNEIDDAKTICGILMIEQLDNFKEFK